MIETIDLCKRYEDGVLALDHQTLCVEAGTIYALLGANGAGKTTTVNLLLGFIPPTSGVAMLAGIDVARDPLGARQHVAYLPENVHLVPNFTARQNLAFFATLGRKTTISADTCAQAMHAVGLPDKAFTQRVSGFSKGMRQKLGIAICILRDTPALILDEPMAGLDPKAAYELADTLTQLRAAGKAILMSTHEVFRAKELADRVGIMKAGRKVAEFSRTELGDRSLESLYLACMREGGEP